MADQPKILRQYHVKMFGLVFTALGLLLLCFLAESILWIHPTDVLSYFTLPVLFILLCMMAMRLVGAKHRYFGWMVHSIKPWVVSWSIIGFGIAAVLSMTAWKMNNDYVLGHTDLVWPFCIGLMALQGESNPLNILAICSILAAGNALYYSVLAALTWMLHYIISAKLPLRLRSVSSPPTNSTPSSSART